eukprot:Pompholyxophrys_punicea_v1_NODE_228_length_2676_cov_112.645555.p1 type:complete len:352 gc:universal NODE_228_length_2676_cov_112.645555:1179-124(-)
MASLHDIVFTKHASEEVKLHAIYAVRYAGYPQNVVAKVFGKSESWISKWLARYDAVGSVARKVIAPTARFRKLEQHHKNWIIRYVHNDPLSFLREICRAFRISFKFDISQSSVLRILEENNYTKQVLETRAMEISVAEITRFTHEVNILKPLWHQMVFIDEMSCDNRGMLRKRGWFLRGKRPIFKSCFRRGSRLSVLSFLGVNGLIANYDTEGTFNRLEFLACVDRLLDSGIVQRHPGQNSVWLLDGASIHLNKHMTDYIRSRGIELIFLPAYCPFYNVIEIIFGQIKRRCRDLYTPENYGSEKKVLATVMAEFSQHYCGSLFRKCGYGAFGYFNPYTNNDLFIKEADMEI